MSNGKRIMILCLLMLLIFSCDIISKGKYGIKQVKKEIKNEVNFYQISMHFFGGDLLLFYDNDQIVDNMVIETYEANGRYYVVQAEETLYLAINGIVTEIYLKENKYQVTILTEKNKITYGDLLSTDMMVYNKVDANTLIGLLEYQTKGYGYYYYYN